MFSVTLGKLKRSDWWLDRKPNEGFDMETGGKILTGVAATALLALVAHYATGEDYINSLEETAQTELAAQGLDGVKVKFNRDPLSRQAVLDGDVSNDVQQKALTIVSNIGEIPSTRWKGDTEVFNAGTTASEAEDTAELATATEAGVAKCQDGVNKSIAGEKMSFVSGSAYLSAASHRLIEKVAVAFKPCSGLAIAVNGHTDDNGPADTNKNLSQERANRVRQALIERGIAENLVSATGYGSDKPLVAGSGAAADAQNRRIEFTITMVEASQVETQQGE